MRRTKFVNTAWGNTYFTDYYKFTDICTGELVSYSSFFAVI